MYLIPYMDAVPGPKYGDICEVSRLVYGNFYELKEWGGIYVYLTDKFVVEPEDDDDDLPPAPYIFDPEPEWMKAYADKHHIYPEKLELIEI